MRRAVIALALLITLTLLGGCWDQRQISNLVMVMGVGIDIEQPATEQGQETVLLTVELARITMENTDGVPVLVTASGPTMTAAVRNLAQSVNKQLHWSHMQFLLIGEEAAQQGVDKYLSMFYNNKDMSPHIYFALCEGEARQALSARAGLSPYVSSGLHDILLKQRQEANGYVYPISLQQYMSEHSQPRCGMLIPLVAARPGTDASITAATVGDMSEKMPAEGVGEGEKDTLYFRGMAVLDYDTKYVRPLVGKENSGAALFLGQMRNFAVVLTEPNMRQRITVELTHWQAKQEWAFGPLPGQITLTLICKAKGELADEQEATHYTDAATVEHLEQLFCLELSRQIKRAWQRSRGLEVDFLGLGMQIYRHHPGQWNDLLPQWPQKLWDVELDVQIDGKVDVAGQSR